MSNAQTKQCVCNTPSKFSFTTWQGALDGYRHAKIMADDGECRHVGCEEFSKREFATSAVYFANCYPKSSPQRCGPAKDELLIFGVLTSKLSKSMKPFTAAVEITASPAHALQLTGLGTRIKDDLSVLELGQQVITPFGLFWKRSVGVQIHYSTETVAAMIKVKLKGEDIRSVPGQEIRLSVGVPPSNAPDLPVGDLYAQESGPSLAHEQDRTPLFVFAAKEQQEDLLHWAGGEQATLAIVFTDILGSTSLGVRLGDEKMNAVREAHFAKSVSFVKLYHGREVKTIGDSVLAVFRSSLDALDYAIDFYRQTGHPDVRIRVGIHIGPLAIRSKDIFGNEVNLAARITSALKKTLEPTQGPFIIVSERVKHDLDTEAAARHRTLQWTRHDLTLDGILQAVTVWSLRPE